MNIDVHMELERVFGFRQFRPGEQQVIQALLEGASSLAIFPTGSGKSLCYQFTAKREMTDRVKPFGNNVQP